SFPVWATPVVLSNFGPSPSSGVSLRARRARLFFTTRYREPAWRTFRRNSVTAGTLSPRKSTRMAWGERPNSWCSSLISSAFSALCISPRLCRGFHGGGIDPHPGAHGGRQRDGADVLPLGRRRLGLEDA